MWLRHQVVLSTLWWLLCGQFPRRSAGNRCHQLSTLSCFKGAVSFAATDKLLHRQSSNSHPSIIRYFQKYGDNRSSNSLLVSSCANSASHYNRPRVPLMRDLHSVDEVIVTAYEHLDVMSRRDISAVWARIALLMTKRQPRQQRKQSNVGDISFKVR